MKKQKITLPDRRPSYISGCEYYFSCNLKRLRLSLYPRMSQARLARELGVTRNTYAGYESGKRIPPAWFIHCAAKYFNVSADELIGQKNNDERKFEHEDITPEHPQDD